MTRIIGYMKRVSNFSAARQKEAAQRYYINASSEKLVDDAESAIQDIVNETQKTAVRLENA
jgi:hypothetical protein